MPLYDFGDPECGECKRAFRSVTGDRETAGVEQVTAAQIGLSGNEQERLAFNLCGEFGSEYVQSKRNFAYSVIAEYRAIVAARATPPSGGGDHAGGEAKASGSGE